MIGLKVNLSAVSREMHYAKIFIWSRCLSAKMCDLLHLVTRLVFRKKCDGIACDILKFLVTSSVSIKRVIVSSDIVTIQSGISVILSYFSVTNNSKKNSLIFVFGVTVSDVVISYNQLYV